MDDKPLSSIDEPTQQDVSTEKIEIIKSDGENTISNHKDTMAVKQEVADVEDRLNEAGILTPELIAEVKKQITAEIVADFKEERTLKTKELEIQREIEDMAYKKYVDERMQSDEPWIDFIGEVRDTEKGQRLQLNWNPAYIIFLKSIGITGSDDEELVQKYIVLLLQDMVDKNENRYGSDYQ